MRVGIELEPGECEGHTRQQGIEVEMAGQGLEVVEQKRDLHCGSSSSSVLLSLFVQGEYVKVDLRLLSSAPIICRSTLVTPE